MKKAIFIGTLLCAILGTFCSVYYYNKYHTQNELMTKMIQTNNTKLVIESTTDALVDVVKNTDYTNVEYTLRLDFKDGTSEFIDVTNGLLDELSMFNSDWCVYLGYDTLESGYTLYGFITRLYNAKILNTITDYLDLENTNNNYYTFMSAQINADYQLTELEFTTYVSSESDSPLTMCTTIIKPIEEN